jgi:hypothetical protein
MKIFIQFSIKCCEILFQEWQYNNNYLLNYDTFEIACFKILFAIILKNFGLILKYSRF